MYSSTTHTRRKRVRATKKVPLTQYTEGRLYAFENGVFTDDFPNHFKHIFRLAAANKHGKTYA